MLKFDEEKHEYTLDGKKLISVTQLMQKHGLAPNYAGVSTDVLKAKAERGSLIHKEIEDFNKEGEIGFTSELQQYVNYIKQNNIIVEASEQKVHNDIVAGTIDLVMSQEEDGEYGEYTSNIIADVKTTYQLHKESVSWQLSIYLWLYLALDYRDAQDEWNDYKAQAFHFDEDGNLNVVDIQLKPCEEVNRLMNYEREGRIYNKEYDNGLIDELAVLLDQKKDLDSRIDDIKSKLIDQIKVSGNYSDERITISYIAPAKKKTFDSTAFKRDWMGTEIWCKYEKESETKEQLRVALKGAKNE